MDLNSFKETIDELTKLAQKVDSGELPKTALPKIVHRGHTLLYGLAGRDWLKCSCGHSWNVPIILPNQGKPSSRVFTCPSCNKISVLKDIYWYHEYNNAVGWRCRECQHKWESENGEVCPKCKAHYKGKPENA